MKELKRNNNDENKTYNNIVFISLIILFCLFLYFVFTT